MSKRNFKQDFDEINNMIGKIRSINEATQYGEEYDDEMPMQYGDEEGEYPQGQMPMNRMSQGMEDDVDAEMQNQVSDPNSPINAIREIALKGMVKLCQTPEDPEYEILKKVFTMIDRANDKKNNEQQQ